MPGICFKYCCNSLYASIRNPQEVRQVTIKRNEPLPSRKLLRNPAPALCLIVAFFASIHKPHKARQSITRGGVKLILSIIFFLTPGICNKHYYNAFHASIRNPQKVRHFTTGRVGPDKHVIQSVFLNQSAECAAVAWSLHTFYPSMTWLFRVGLQCNLVWQNAHLPCAVNESRVIIDFFQWWWWM